MTSATTEIGGTCVREPESARESIAEAIAALEVRLRHPTSLDGADASVAPMTISVVIPVFNGADFVSRAIESVLSQSYPATEIIVVDDGSTDSTLEVLDEFEGLIHVLKQANHGHASARNAAARVATGEWIAQLDADDFWSPHKLAQQMKLATSADVLYTAAINFKDAERVDGQTFRHCTTPCGDVFDDLLLDNFITHSSVVCRRAVFLAASGYDESLRTTCDWELWLRLAASGCRFVGCSETLTHYRWSATSNSRNHYRTCSDRLNVLFRALDSARAQRVPVIKRLKAVARVWQTSAWFVAEHDDRTALQWYLNSLRFRPYSIRGWKEVARCCAHLCGVSRKTLFRRGHRTTG